MIAISTQLLGEVSHNIIIIDFVFTTYNKMKKKKYNTVGTVPTLNRKIVEIGKFDISNTHINDPSWRISGTSIKRDGVKLVYSRFF
jgi:hypothetical protein